MKPSLVPLWIIPAVMACLGAALFTRPSPTDQIIYAAASYLPLHLANRIVNRKVKAQARRWVLVLLRDAVIAAPLGLVWFLVFGLPRLQSAA